MPYQKYIKKVPGLKNKNIMLFALSTCIWCKKTKALLKDLGLEHSYVDVDLLFGADQEEAYNEMWKHNQGTSFPTIIINNGEEMIIGFDEEKLKSLK
jgi:glutaredoxin-like protein NrdH